MSIKESGQGMDDLWSGWFAKKEFMYIGRPEVKGATDTHLEVK